MEKFKGIIPALYACYGVYGEVSEERTKGFTSYLIEKGINGLYVGGSSGECIYQSLEERKETLRYAAEEANGKATLIAHVGAPSTRDSVILAKYAEELGYDAVSAIPPIYFVLSEESIEAYWTEIVESTSLPFIIYNIPQTTGYQLSLSLFKKMMAHPQVIGVKNSSMPVMDIERFAHATEKEVVIFNGPDEQFIAGRMMGAAGGIGGTYGVMPELFLAAEKAFVEKEWGTARAIQSTINDIITELTSQRGQMYAVIKSILELRGLELGGVRAPLRNVTEEELPAIQRIKEKIDQAIEQFA